MDGSEVGTIEVSRSMGRNAPNLIADLAVTGVLPGIMQLVFNSYDADASRVDIEYDPGKGVLRVEDDGSGMRKGEGLDDFFRLGDSVKLENPISPGGRRRHGNHGVATIVLKGLCDKYELDTKRNGVRTVIKETLEDVISSDRVIPGRTSGVSAEEHGTVLTLEDLKFPADHFELGELRKKIQWDIPLLPDFRVSLNGVEVPVKSVDSATVFKTDAIGAEMGNVTGEIYLTRSPTPSSGIHVYVNGGRIGDPRALLANSLSNATLSKRIVGVINADDLEGARMFDKGRFKEDHPGILELQATIKKALSKVQAYSEKLGSHTSLQRLESRVPAILDNVRKRMVGAELVPSETSFEFARLDEDVPGKYDFRNGVLVLNENHPSLFMTQGMNFNEYQRAVMESAIDTLALSPDVRSLSVFSRKRNKFWDQLSNLERNKQKKMEIHPLILYTPSALAQFSSRSPSAIKHMVGAGLLASEEKGILGRDFLKAEKDTMGLVEFYDFIRDRGPKSEDYPAHYRRITNMVDASGAAMKPFIYGVGNSDNPCVFVEETCANAIYDLYKSPATHLRGVGSSEGISREFKNFGEQFYSLPQLAKMSKGMGAQEMAGVIDYAKGHNLPIATSRVGNGVGFLHRDMVSALQDMRGNNEVVRASS